MGPRQALIPPPPTFIILPNSVVLNFLELKLKIHIIRNVFHSIVFEKRRPNVFFPDFPWGKIRWPGLWTLKPTWNWENLLKMDRSFHGEFSGLLRNVFHFTVHEKRRPKVFGAFPPLWIAMKTRLPGKARLVKINLCLPFDFFHQGRIFLFQPLQQNDTFFLFQSIVQQLPHWWQSMHNCNAQHHLWPICTHWVQEILRWFALMFQ